MNKRKDTTIFALSTPTGKSALALIRISGKNAIKILKKISLNTHLENRVATLNTLVTQKNEKIDKSISTIFKSPNSYTGEDMVELSVHGSAAIISKLIKTLNQFDTLRIAEPGEFTRRAFENNKLDLTQVEAISDLINSETEAQRKQALNHLSGLFSDRIKLWEKRILKILSSVEAVIDFSDEDLPENLIKDTKEQIENIYREIDLFLSDNEVGEKIRNGFIIAIVGKPNVGKSSFLNLIAKREIAIVTEEPGTTRDAIELFTNFKGLPVRFFDTAGIRKSENKAELLGVKKTHEILEFSDINLIFLESKKCTADFKSLKNKIFVQSKIDINKKIKSESEICYISSLKKTGIDELFNKIYKDVSLNIKTEEINVSRERHRAVLKNTTKHLKESLNIKNIDLFAEDIRMSLNEISKIYGKKDVEDVLDIIFSDFCIGK
tara:strand:+ start:353 stop:1663 length:1311 start_codon:yes stop_codon:yes gene_type:complete